MTINKNSKTHKTINEAIFIGEQKINKRAEKLFIELKLNINKYHRK